MDTVIHSLEEELGLIVSARKSVAVASNINVAVATADMINSGRDTAVPQAKLLGVITVAGGRRRISALEVRCHQFNKVAPQAARASILLR